MGDALRPPAAGPSGPSGALPGTSVPAVQTPTRQGRLTRPTVTLDRASELLASKGFQNTPFPVAQEHAGYTPSSHTYPHFSVRGEETFASTKLF